jgi:adenosylcobyric acid synthase
MKGALMVCGTASDVGKSHVVTALCRVLARRGVRVAPFKAQNMALNSFVTASGHEIGRAQAVQAWAANVEPEVGMNPILLKPTGERTSQVVVMGRPAGHLDAVAYQAAKPRLRATVLEALADLRGRFDVVLLEGAGSAAEVNLLAEDIVNLRLAAAAKIPAMVVGDIDRGGVFAALYGTVALLPDDLRPLVRAFVINKLRGDPALLGNGLVELERRCGVPTLGVLPWIHDVALDAEDSLALAGRRPAAVEPPLAATLDVAAVRLPRIANFTDLDALSTEPGVGVRLVEHASALGDPDLLVLPGTKATVADLEWLRGRGLDRAMADARKRGTVTVGICGGYQMLGQLIVDGVESGRGRVAGLGWLDAITVFRAAKLTRQRRGRAMGLSVRSGTQPRVTGYEIHHGRVTRGAEARPWLRLDDTYGIEDEGAVDPAAEREGVGAVFASSLHGLFEEDGFRGAFLSDVARRRGKEFVPAGRSFAQARECQIDCLADMVDAHLDMAAVDALIKEGALS